MKRIVSNAAIIAAALGACGFLSATEPARAQTGACAFPTSPASSAEETAWQLFVAANCPGTGSQVVWESWIEQSELYPAGAAVAAAAGQAPPRLHGSPLARALQLRSGGLAAAILAPSTECNKMRGPPANVIKDATVCEEAHLNPEAQAFIVSQKFQTRAGQTAAAARGGDFDFPPAAIEVKVDWIPASDFNPPFTCSDPPSGVRVATVDGSCYAMAGMHIASKLLNNWLWATFEPQSMVTNPLRCITFGPCNDSWGATPATSNGGPGGSTQLKPELEKLMKQANLAPEFLNYRLDGVQTDFTSTWGKALYLGNSIIEGENVGMTINTASCITCHSISSIKKDGTDGISVLGPGPTGPQYQPPADWVSRDFVWSLSLACPKGIQNCK
jgi:hypothetical protein